MEKTEKIYIISYAPIPNPLKNIRYTTKQYKKKTHITIKTIFVKIFDVKK